jgi:plasmid stabilization system protein ParE
MARRVVWSHRARSDLRNLVVWIRKDSPRNAEAVANRIVARAATLADQPGQGRRVPEHDGEFRKVIVQSWRVIYRVTDATVVIVAIVHTARLLRNVAPL